MFDEDELRPLSALQHLVFCERQCALIHLEQVWAENRYTAEGRIVHKAADSGSIDQRGDRRIVRSLDLRSLRLGLVGRADVVEFRRVGPNVPGIALPNAEGHWHPFPVEYKRGKPKTHRADEVQLCAQALCLEETFDLEVPEGALYYNQKRRRLPVSFDHELRKLTEDSARRLHRLLDRRKTPRAIRERKCNTCSLLDVCLPDAPQRSAQTYLLHLLGDID